MSGSWKVVFLDALQLQHRPDRGRFSGGGVSSQRRLYLLAPVVAECIAKDPIHAH